jgi:hypothetical protein
VGASATELAVAIAGRRTISVRTTAARRYRGMDILWWLDRMSLLDAGTSDVRRGSGAASTWLVGRPEAMDGRPVAGVEPPAGSRRRQRRVQFADDRRVDTIGYCLFRLSSASTTSTRQG